jgi:HK97 family phage portal protein
MSKKTKRAAKQNPIVKRPQTDFDRAVDATRSFYSNAVAWGTNLLTDARDEYSLDDVTAARLYAISVTSWACANFRAEVESGIPAQVVDAFKEPVPEADNPIPWFMENYISLMFRTSLSVLIWGKFYIRKVRNVNGLPIRLEYLNPLDVSPLVDYERQEFMGFNVRGRDKIVEPDDMIVELTYDPLNDFDGVSPYEVAMRQIVGNRELVRFGQKYFEEGTMLGGMLTYSGDIDDEQFKTVQKEMRQFKGSNNAFRTLLLGGGLTGFDYKQMQPNPVDLAMKEFKDILDGDTCTAFGVHPILIGKGDANDPLSANNTYDQIHIKFTLTKAIPRVKWIFESLNRQWLHKDFGAWGKLSLVPDLSEINEASKSAPERATTAKDLFTSGIWTTDEAREYTGKKPLGGAIQGDPTWALGLFREGGIKLNELRHAVGYDPAPKDGFIYELDPRAQTPKLPAPPGVGAMMAPRSIPESVVQPQLNSGIPEDTEEAEIVPSPPIRSDPLLTKAKLFELDNWAKKTKRKGIDAEFTYDHIPEDIATFVRAELGGLWNPRSVFAEAKRAVRQGDAPNPLGATPEDAAEYWRDYDNLKIDLARDFAEYMRLASEPVFDALASGQSVDLDTALANQRGALMANWLGTLEQPGPLLAVTLAGMASGDRSLQKGIAANPAKPRAFDTGVSWNLLSDQAVTFTRSYGFDLIRRIDDTTKSAIRDAIERSVTEGIRGDALRDLIAQTLVPPGAEISDAINIRSAAIGQTESQRAFVSGSFQRWSDAGVTEATWQTVRDGDNVCPRCRAIYGNRANYRTGWYSPVDGETLTPPRHVNCRCFARPVVA